jgi:hypothetical protein
MIDIKKHTDIDERLDELEVTMRLAPNQLEFPVIHRFTPGLYIREIYMPKEALIMSKIHRTEHPFVISKGSVYVRNKDGTWELLEAPYTGITYPGTRRVLSIKEDCIWTTFHPTDIEPTDPSDEAVGIAVARIEERIIEPNERVMDKMSVINNKTYIV